MDFFEQCAICNKNHPELGFLCRYCSDFPLISALDNQVVNIQLDNFYTGEKSLPQTGVTLMDCETADSSSHLSWFWDQGQEGSFRNDTQFLTMPPTRTIPFPIVQPSIVSSPIVASPIVQSSIMPSPTMSFPIMQPSIMPFPTMSFSTIPPPIIQLSRSEPPPTTQPSNRKTQTMSNLLEDAKNLENATKSGNDDCGEIESLKESSLDIGDEIEELAKKHNAKDKATSPIKPLVNMDPLDNNKHSPTKPHSFGKAKRQPNGRVKRQTKKEKILKEREYIARASQRKPAKMIPIKTVHNAQNLETEQLGAQNENNPQQNPPTVKQMTQKLSANSVSIHKEVEDLLKFDL